MPEENLAKGARLGYRRASQDELLKEKLDEKYAGFSGAALAGGLGVGSALMDLPAGVVGMAGAMVGQDNWGQALPTSADLYEELGLPRHEYGHLKEQHSAAFTLGEVAGSMVGPSAWLGRGTAALGTRLAAKLGGGTVGTIAGYTLPMAAEGAIYSSAMQVRDDDIRNLESTSEKVLASAVGGALIGGVVGGTLGIGAAGLKKLGIGAQRLAGEASEKMLAAKGDDAVADAIMAQVQKRWPNATQENLVYWHSLLVSKGGGKRFDDVYLMHPSRKAGARYPYPTKFSPDMHPSELPFGTAFDEAGVLRYVDDGIVHAAAARSHPERVTQEAIKLRNSGNRVLKDRANLELNWDRADLKLKHIDEMMPEFDYELNTKQFKTYHDTIEEIVTKNGEYYRFGNDEFPRHEIRKFMEDVTSAHKAQWRDTFPNKPIESLEDFAKAGKLNKTQAFEPDTVKAWLDKYRIDPMEAYTSGTGSPTRPNSRLFQAQDRLREMTRGRIERIRNMRDPHPKYVDWANELRKDYEQIIDRLGDETIWGDKLAQFVKNLNGQRTRLIAAEDNLRKLGIMREFESGVPGLPGDKDVEFIVERLVTLLGKKSSDEGHIMVRATQDYFRAHKEIAEDLGKLTGLDVSDLIKHSDETIQLLEDMGASADLHMRFQRFKAEELGVMPIMAYAGGVAVGGRSVGAAAAGTAKFITDPVGYTNVLMDSPDRLAAMGYVKDKAGGLVKQGDEAITKMLGRKPKPDMLGLAAGHYLNTRAQYLQDEFPGRMAEEWLAEKDVKEQRDHDNRLAHLQQLSERPDEVERAVTFSMAPLGAVGMQLAGPLSRQANAAIKALAGQSALASLPTGTLDGARLKSKAEIQHLDRMWEIISKPRVFLEDVASGTASDSDIKMFRKVYPRWFEELQQNVLLQMSGMAASHQEPHYRARLQASAITGQKTTALVGTQYMAEMNSFYKKQAMSQQTQPQQAKRKSMELSQAYWYETGSQRAERGEGK